MVALGKEGVSYERGTPVHKLSVLLQVAENRKIKQRAKLTLEPLNNIGAIFRIE